MKKFTLIALGFIALGLAGCGDSSSSTTPAGGGSAPAASLKGDAEKGKTLYNSVTLGKRSAAGCVACHKYDESMGDQKKAPFTKGTATRAESRKAGMTAEQYIHESIVKPDEFLVPNYKKGDMYGKWAEDLSEQDIADLTAYLLTEK